MKEKAASAASVSDEELLDDIERVLIKARAANRPFIEYLLNLAFVEALEVAGAIRKLPTMPAATERLH